jgi:hypothetical protein
MAPRRLRSTGLEWRQVDDEIVAVDLRSHVYLTLNETGAVVWKLLAEGCESEEELVDAIVSMFDTDVAQASSDVRAFLGELESKGFLE